MFKAKFESMKADKITSNDQASIFQWGHKFQMFQWQLLPYWCGPSEIDPTPHESGESAKPSEISKPKLSIFACSSSAGTPPYPTYMRCSKGLALSQPPKNSRTWMGTDSFHSPFWCLNRYPTPSKRIRAAFCTQGSVAYQHSKIPPSCTRLDLSLENAGDGWWIGCHVYRKQVSTHCKYRAFWFSYQVVDSLSLGPRIKSSVIEVPIARSNLVCPQKWQN